MRLPRPHPLFCCGVVLCLLCLPATVSRAADDAPYAALLAVYVQNGVADYAGLKKDEARLNAYLDALASTNPETLSPNDRFAYYINAYNAWTLRLILDHYPGISSIKDAGSLFRSPWKQPFVRLAGRTVTLDHIEHDILRPQFRDPRLHFAINCASKSCPPLASRPYEGPTLDAALDAAARSFVNNPAQVFLRDGTLHVSRIFDWYGDDFGGEDGVWRFIRHYAATPLAKAMDAAKDHRLVYTAYDWSLNGR